VRQCEPLFVSVVVFAAAPRALRPLLLRWLLAADIRRVKT
jgi:hypothetical protein